MNKANNLFVLVLGVGISSAVFATPSDWDPGSKAGNVVSNGITDTRHNMTMSYLNRVDTEMDFRRNNYGEVCVYCHTPHGANTSQRAIGMPLWNRTIDTSHTYNLYDMPTMQMGADQNVTMPGPASLTCLSCHDGVTAIDSIINMPGSGGYQKSQETSQDTTNFLRQWDQKITADSSTLRNCADVCHNPGGSPGDFTAFVIGAGSPNAQGSLDVDLRDDHPVGVLYPTTFGPGGFRAMDAQTPLMAFFDPNQNGRADKNEIRIYNSGEGYEVECASCHDPHGVPDSTGDRFIPSFLRVENGASALCQACHDK